QWADRDGAGHSGALSRSRLPANGSTEGAEAVAHVGVAVALDRRLDVEAWAVVGDFEHEHAVVLAESQSQAGAFRVLRRVLHRLETAEVHRGFDFARVA